MMKRRLFPEYRNKDEERNSIINNNGGEANSNNSPRDTAAYAAAAATREPLPFQQMQDITLEYLAQMETDSAFFVFSTEDNYDDSRQQSSRYIPQFEPQEIELGKPLGMGEFGVLLKVSGIQLVTAASTTSSEHGTTTDSDGGLFEAHRSVSSSINLSAMATTADSSITRSALSRSVLSSSDPMAFGNAAISAPPSDVSRSITLAELARPVIPIEQRTTAQHFRASLFARSTATSLDKNQAQILREDLATQVSASARQSDLRSSDAQGTFGSNAQPHGRRLALKQIRKDLYPKKKLEAAKDLAREAKFLARLHHPNIIRLRGVVSQPGRLEFGLLLDRLEVTLSEEVLQWHHRQQDIIASHRNPVVAPVLEAFSSLFQPSQSSKEESSNSNQDLSGRKARHYTRRSLHLLGERILALWDVALGMQYLHSHNILFRDLKTENVGTLLIEEVGDSDMRHEVIQHQRMQIFDFGLAKECKEVNRVAVVTGLEHHPKNKIDRDFYSAYHMTALTGTLRIMAPEVIQCLPYGLSADVYSFGVCLWEVFSSTKENASSPAEICEGARPAIPGFDGNSGTGMPFALQSLLKRCWAKDPLNRPAFDEVSDVLYQQLVQLQERRATMPPSRPSSQSNTRNNSRSSSPLGWMTNNNNNTGHQQADSFHKAAVQAAFWKRLETIHSSSTILDVSNKSQSTSS